MKSFYLTTTLPYVNAEPHIGFALEIIQADALVRYQRLLGKDVFFNTGTDEHGLKIYRKARERGVDPQTYCDEYAAKFRDLASVLTLDHPTFIRTTDPHHIRAAQEFWKRCDARGDIYKKNYRVKYCVGCELEKTESELVDGHCPIHPKLEIELINEENYFFRFSAYQQPLLEYYERSSQFVIPGNRQKEITEFVKRGLEDFSISRLKEKMPWGVPVPGDDAHVMYVWFDALINYISTLGWPESDKQFETFWGTIREPNAIQIAGKDNLRQQTAMWQAMLMSAKLPPSKQVFIHGFVTSEGQKMSKSLGNVVDPYVIVSTYGVDALRFYALGSLPSYEDGDFSVAKFEAYYTAHLANGVGNLTNRILTMLEKYCDGKVPGYSGSDIFATEHFWQEYESALGTFQFDSAIRIFIVYLTSIDGCITKEKPWEKVKTGENIEPFLYQLAESLRHMALALLPIIPSTSEKVLASLGIDAKSLRPLSEEQHWGKLPSGAIITKGEPLFPRLSLSHS